MSERIHDSLGPVQALRGAARLVAHDPVGILLPAMGLLGLQVMVLMEMRQAFFVVGPMATFVGGALAWLVVAVASAPLRDAMLRRGALAAGRPAPRRRLLALAGAQVLVALVEVALLAVVLGALAVLSWGLLAYGWFSLAALMAGIVLVVASGVGLVVGVLLAWAPLEVVFGGASGAGALWASLRRGLGSHAGVAVLGGGVATAVGSALCLAGALPGYPLRDLALLLAYPEGSS